LHLPLRKMNSGYYAQSAILCQAKNRADGRKSPPAGISPRSGPDDSLFDFSLRL
jgi:hypothetical protein